MKETDDPDWVRLMRDDLRHFWENGGNDHFREEEEILFPTYSRYADVNRPEIIEALVEHAKIRGLIQFVVNQDDSSIEEMNRLGELLRNHIKKEERMVFPLMESAIPEDVLHQMSSQFSEFKPKDRTSYVRRES
jgi:hemerythrin-like domain-containing protein